MARKYATKAEAVRALNERYTEQSLRYPWGFRNIPRDLYVRGNLPAMLRASTPLG